MEKHMDVENLAALAKGICAGTLILLATMKPNFTDRKQMIVLATRFAAGLGFAIGGTELVQYFYEGIPVSAVSAILMAYGLRIGKHLEKFIDKLGNKLTGSNTGSEDRSDK